MRVYAAFGPFLFDTSAESFLARSPEERFRNWLRSYLEVHPIHVSAVTVIERARGYAILWAGSDRARRRTISMARLAYFESLGTVWPVDTAVAVVAAEIMALVPQPPTPPKRAHRTIESRQERLARWRFDCIVAATALVARLPLIHNNAADFEPIRTVIEFNPEQFPRLGPLTLVRCQSLV